MPWEPSRPQLKQLAKSKDEKSRNALREYFRRQSQGSSSTNNRSGNFRRGQGRIRQNNANNRMTFVNSEYVPLKNERGVRKRPATWSKPRLGGRDPFALHPANVDLIPANIKRNIH